MLAYHNDSAIKTGIIAQLEAHRAADQLMKGVYWQHGKGCAVGCTVHSGNHAEYEKRFGIPRVLARLEDRIFEGLPNAKAMEWPVRFMSAIAPGADLSRVWNRFGNWLLVDNTWGVIRHAKTDVQRAIIREIAQKLMQPDAISESEWRELRRRAAAAAAAAYAAAAYAAAYATAAAYAADAAAAYATAAAPRTGESARENHFVAQSDKLIELLSEAHPA